MELRRFLLAALFCIGLQGSGQAQGADFLLPDPSRTLPPPVASVVGEMRATHLAADISFLASPRMEGRGLGSRGLDLASEYLAARLAAARLAPLGDQAKAGGRSWFQIVPFRRVLNPSGTLTIRQAGAAQTLVLAAGADGLFPKLAPGSMTLPLVFAGHGIQEQGMGHDDFKNLDVRGKAVLFLAGLPPGDAWRKPPYLGRYAAEDPEDRYDARIEQLRRRGAAAAIAIEEDFPAPGKAARLAAEPGFLDPAEAPPSDGPLLLRLPAAKGREILRLLAITPVATATLSSGGTLQPVASRNVLAVLRGSDPRLRDEAVVLGAHYDHLGQREGVTYPGADDNASGVAALLEIARSFAASPQKPKRTLVFAFWTGEEEAKFGSSHYVRHPAWPLARTTAYLNLDMIGHPWTREEIRNLVGESRLENAGEFLERVKTEDFIEPGVASGAPWLGPLLAQAGSGLGYPLHLDWTDGLHGGSDYKPFARAGVPFVRFFGNFHPDYHKPGDTPERLDPEQVLKIARLAFATAWLLAEKQPDLPAGCCYSSPACSAPGWPDLAAHNPRAPRWSGLAEREATGSVFLSSPAPCRW